MAATASALVLAGNGTNCERETAHACRMGGFGRVDTVTVWELLHADARLADYNLLCLPGGFLDGDDLGSAKAQANRFLHSTVAATDELLFHQILRFIKDGGLILGICNGFQLLVKLGLLPALDNDYGHQTATLTSNDSGRFEDRWVHLSVNPRSPCVFTSGMQRVYYPVRHGEGKFVARDSELLDRIIAANQVVFSYIEAQSGQPTNTYPDNPNGAQAAIAGICDPTGRVMGLMPHPEAYLFRENHPRWTREDVPAEGMGVPIFRNACEYVKSAYSSK